ncbi:hypothetical protein ACWKW4_17575 [Hydrogenophaga borbori]|uniref:hypothetical protein n=1 Tax=Hydrogenophaga sp. PBC TaxID=795665 RepID=UPI0002EFFD81|nr:hypothetical protein [Hydrogenophaga sp. PBC]
MHGILVQLPLPSPLDERAVLEASGQSALVPCTPAGYLHLLQPHWATLPGGASW